MRVCSGCPCRACWYVIHSVCDGLAFLPPHADRIPAGCWPHAAHPHDRMPHYSMPHAPTLPQTCGSMEHGLMYGHLDPEHHLCLCSLTSLSTIACTLQGLRHSQSGNMDASSAGSASSVVGVAAPPSEDRLPAEQLIANAVRQVGG